MQEVTPEEFRGRVNAADFLVGAGGAQLGSLEAGLVGSWTTPVISALSGGLLTIAGALAIGVALPGFRRYESVPHEPASGGPASGGPASGEPALEQPAPRKPDSRQPAGPATEDEPVAPAS